MTRRGRPPHPDVLTPAEWSVLDGVRSGLTNAEIAERLGISVNTVRYHVSNMLTKVGVRDRQALAAWEGVPVSGVRFTRGGLLALTRFLGLAAALVVAAALAWLALDRLAGVTSELPAGAAAPSATPFIEASPTPIPGGTTNSVPFVSEGDLWARAVVGNGSTGLNSPFMGVRQDGTIVAAATVGTYDTPTVEVGGSLLSRGGLDDIILAAFTLDGQHLWSRLIGGPGNDYVTGLTITDGGFVVVGFFEETIDIGSETLTVAGSRDGFAVAFDNQGIVAWALGFASPGNDGLSDVALLLDGDLAVVGYSSGDGPMAVGTREFSASPESSAFIARLSPLGEPRWIEPLPGARYAGSLVVLPESGDIVAGRWDRLSSEPGGGATGLMRIGDRGDVVWERLLRDGGVGSLPAISLAPDGSLVVAGTFDVATDFGGGTIEPRGGRSGFLARYSADGEHLWSRALIRTADFVESVAVDDDGGIWVAGEGLIERYSEDGKVVEATLDFAATAPLAWGPHPNDPSGSVGRPARLGTLVIESAGLPNGEILIGGRFQYRLALPFDGRLLSPYWAPHFISRIEAP